MESIHDRLAGSRRAAPNIDPRRQLILGDAISVGLGWAVAASLSISHIGTDRSIAGAAVAAVWTFGVMQLSGLHRARPYSDSDRQTLCILLASLIGGAALAMSEWFAGHISIASVGAGTVSAAALTVALRWRFSRWLKHKRAEGRFLRTVILVGANDDAAVLCQTAEDEPELGLRVGGVVSSQANWALWDQLPHTTSLRDIPGLAHAVGADSIILVGSAFAPYERPRVVRDCLASGLPVQFWPGLTGILGHRMRVSGPSGLSMLDVDPSRSAAWQLAAKRAMDITVSALLLPLTAPVLLVVALAIRMEDGGPVLYRHSVIGRDGIRMEVLKLRTMVPNAAQMLEGIAAMNERKGGPLFKATNDPRVTRIGRILRATSIDELPQLWDVLAGRMSLVGPRFALPREAAQFDEELQRRTIMRPGMTGLWQTESRDNPSFSAYRRLDLLYVDNWSLRMDLAILANTAHAVTVRAVRAIRPGNGHSASSASSVAAMPSVIDTSGAESY